MPYLAIVRVRDGLVMERRWIGTLDERKVAKAIAEWTRGEQLGPGYYVDDRDVERERRRLAGDPDRDAAQANRDVFKDRAGLIGGIDYRG